MYKRGNKFVRFFRRNSFTIVLAVTVVAFVVAGSALLKAGGDLKNTVAVDQDDLAAAPKAPLEPTTTPKTTATPFPEAPSVTEEEPADHSKASQNETEISPSDGSPSEASSSASQTAVATQPESFSMIKPVEGEVVVAYTDDTLIYSETMDDYRTHKAIDVKAELSTPVKAAEAGVVESVQTGGILGTTIVIDHQNGLKTVYSNLSTETMVQKGQSVKKGDVISGIGDTASSEALLPPHLHFEVLKDGAAVNPLDLIPY